MKFLILLLLLLNTKDDLLGVASKTKVDLKRKTYLVLKDSSQVQLKNSSNPGGKGAMIDNSISRNARARSFGIYLIW